jgi:predicted secreted Zn-dependent protease
VKQRRQDAAPTSQPAGAPRRKAAAEPLLLQLQQGAGNRAVTRLHGLPATSILRHAADAALARQVVQREEDAPTPLDTGTGAAGGGGAAPTFKHSSTTVKIDADSAIDFSNKITAQIGSPHTEIELEPDVQYDFKNGPDGKEDPSTRKVVSVGLTVTTKIVKVRFGMGRPNEKHKKAIDEMVATIQAHEEAHRAIVVSEATTALQKAQKLVGTKKVDEAYKILNGVDCAAAKGHEALDAKEGLLTASEDANGNVTISKSASGATYPCQKA